MAKIRSATWIWSQWLNEHHRTDLKYRYFTHYEFVEDKAKRNEVEADLAALLYKYHTSSPVSVNLLTQLKFRQLASILTRNNDQRPHTPTTRSGNLIEILASEFAMQQGYDIPVLRLRYNPNPDQSMKGDDILGFRFAESRNESDALLVGEGKFRSRFAKTVVEEAYRDLQSKARSYPASMEFVSTILASGKSFQGGKPTVLCAFHPVLQAGHLVLFDHRDKLLRQFIGHLQIGSSLTYLEQLAPLPLRQLLRWEHIQPGDLSR